MKTNTAKLRRAVTMLGAGLAFAGGAYAAEPSSYDTCINSCNDRLYSCIADKGSFCNSTHFFCIEGCNLVLMLTE